MILYILPLFLITIISCSKDKETIDEDKLECYSMGGNENQLKSILSIHTNPFNSSVDSLKDCYNYNSQNQLQSINFPTHKIIYNYDQDGNIINYNFEQNGQIEHGKSYTYDSLQRLIKYSTPSNEVSLTYQSNSIITTGLSIQGSAVMEVEINNDGRITKIEYEHGGYLIFQYDQNQNIVSSEYFSENDLFQNRFEYFYDTSTNPFFGLLDSIYLERFFNLIDRYGYILKWDASFPYLSNNITSISAWNINTGNTLVLSAIYEYNNINMPVYMQSTIISNDNGVIDSFLNY